jgi:type IV pilus assembly protein PilE
VKKQQGFTLIELMIAVAIAGTLASIAYPSYAKYIQKAKRAQAQAALMSMASAMEQWRVENNNNYLGAKDATTEKILIFANSVPTDGGTKTYTLSIPALNQTSYTLMATPEGAQLNDECGSLTLNSAGKKAAVKDNVAVMDCWE